LRRRSDLGQTRLVEESAAAFAQPTKLNALRGAFASRFLALARRDFVLFCEFRQTEAGYVATSEARRELPSPPLVLPSRGA
jgi:hypothetical protein